MGTDKHSPKIRLIAPADFTTSVWSGGITREILISPPEAAYAARNFIYRISTARVDDATSVFTLLSDYRRYIVPLNGALDLTIDSSHVRVEPLTVFEFDGAAQVSSSARPGLVDLNLMVRKGHGGRLFLGSELPLRDPDTVRLILQLKTDTAEHFIDIAQAALIPPGGDPAGLYEGGSDLFPAGPTRAMYAIFELPDA